MISRTEFHALHHAVTLLGMSGVGKTMLSSRLRKTGRGGRGGSGTWFHYSADYRIGTRYLAEEILDNIKSKIMEMKDSFVADLLRSDSIYISHNITVDNLEPVSTFVGMFGDPRRGGLERTEFERRQRLYGEAERLSMLDVAHFIDRAWRIYRCKNFVNDASGSLCEIVALDGVDPVLDGLDAETLILYIRPDRAGEAAIRSRAVRHPKPLFYNAEFIRPRLDALPEAGRGTDPPRFAAGLFADLLEFRKARYQKIADDRGVTVDVGELLADDDGAAAVCDAERFLDILYAKLRDLARTEAGAARLDRYVAACRRRQAARG